MKQPDSRKYCRKATERIPLALAALVTTLLGVLVLAGCGAPAGSDGFNGYFPTYPISGTITDATTGQGVANISVALTGYDFSASTSTDAKGHYSFAHLNVSKYNITPTLAGASFSPTTILVNLDGQLAPQNFVVTQAAPAPAAHASAGGIWVGTDPISGAPVLGLVAETGQMFFSDEGPTTAGAYYVGQFTVDGSSANADVEAITMQSSIYPDRATSGTGTLGGHIVEGVSIDGGITVNTDPATSIAGGQTFNTPLSVMFSSQYNRASSLATIAGTYGPGSLTLTVSSNGVLFAQDAGTGCVINGTIAIVDPRFNMYGVALTTMNCATEFGVPDGAHLEGLATLGDSQAPEYLIIAAADAVSATKSALMITMNRM
jgi:Carboxypeptidase regulatory-like domain